MCYNNSTKENKNTFKNERNWCTMTNATVKMTKAEALNAILGYVQDNADLTAFVNHEIDLLTKKAEKSAEKRAEKAGAYADTLVNVKAVLAAAENAMTVTDILKAGAFDMSNQKMTYILKAGIADGTITKATIKGRTYYTIA